MHSLLPWFEKLAEQTNVRVAFSCFRGIEESQEPILQECYFCLINMKRFIAKHRIKIAYPNLESTQRPVPHDPFMPAPVLTEDGLPAHTDVLEKDSNEKSIPASSNFTDSEKV